MCFGVPQGVFFGKLRLKTHPLAGASESRPDASCRVRGLSMSFRIPVNTTQRGGAGVVTMPCRESLQPADGALHLPPDARFLHCSSGSSSREKDTEDQMAELAFAMQNKRMSHDLQIAFNGLSAGTCAMHDFLTAIRKLPARCRCAPRNRNEQSGHEWGIGLRLFTSTVSMEPQYPQQRPCHASTGAAPAGDSCIGLARRLAFENSPTLSFSLLTFSVRALRH